MVPSHITRAATVWNNALEPNSSLFLITVTPPSSLTTLSKNWFVSSVPIATVATVINILFIKGRRSASHYKIFKERVNWKHRRKRQRPRSSESPIRGLPLRLTNAHIVSRMPSSKSPPPRVTQTLLVSCAKFHVRLPIK